MITNGTGKAVVVNTGMDTEMGKIADMIVTAGTQETPLQRNWSGLRSNGNDLPSICAIVALIGVLRGEPIIQMLLGGISLAVAAVPEGLPAVADHRACHRSKADGSAKCINQKTSRC